MSEITTLKEDFSKYASEVSAKLQTLKTKLHSISQLSSFTGKTADSAKSYFATVHGELITELEEAMNQLDKNMIKITSEFNQIVDQSNHAIIKENYLHEVLDHVSHTDQDVQEVYHGENTVNQKISDIVALNNYQIDQFSSSIQDAKKRIQKVMEDLHLYDQQALKLVKNSKEKISSLSGKVALRKMNHQATFIGAPTNLSVRTEDEKSITDHVNGGISSFRHILAGLNTTDKRLTTIYQSAVLLMMDKKQRMHFIKTGRHSLNLASYRKFNNLMRFTPFKMSSKEYSFLKNSGKKLSKLEQYKKLIIPFGKERGKLAMIKEFDRLYGLEKYQKFKGLKTTGAKTLSMGKTFIDELIGKKIKTTNTILKNSSWKKPQTFLKSYADEFKVSTKDANVLGKTTKAIGRGLGPLSAALHIRENWKDNKGNTQKVIVGSAVDIAGGSVATAVGAAVGSAFLPPIGTVVGGVVGAGLSSAFHAKIPWGNPPKSLSDHSKELVNKGVNSAKKAAKSIGKKISKWFK